MRKQERFPIRKISSLGLSDKDFHTRMLRSQNEPTNPRVVKYRWRIPGLRSGQNRIYAAVAQLVVHLLGKQEVRSPSLRGSSICGVSSVGTSAILTSSMSAVRSRHAAPLSVVGSISSTKRKTHWTCVGCGDTNLKDTYSKSQQ